MKKILVFLMTAVLLAAVLTGCNALTGKDNKTPAVNPTAEVTATPTAAVTASPEASVLPEVTAETTAEVTAAASPAA